MVMLSETVVGQPPNRLYAEARPLHSRIHALNLSEPADWNRVSESHPDASVFHSVEWMKVLAETYRLNPISFVATQDEVPQALVPLFEVAFLGSRKAVSLPFSDFCQPLVSDTLQTVEFWRHLTDAGRARGWRSIELRGGKRLTDVNNASVSFLGHVLSLDQNAGSLWSGLDGSVRRAIRKAEREGVTTEISGEIEGVREYYRLHCQTRRRHGLPPQPFGFFERLWEHLIAKDLGRVVLARFQGAAVAGAVFLRFGKKALFKFGASDRALQHLRANDLVMWQAIQRFRADGCTSLHLGRTSCSNTGLRRFKLGWGTDEHTIHYFKYDLRRSAFVKDGDKAFGWHNALFRLMPTSLARVAGSLLYRRFA